MSQKNGYTITRERHIHQPGDRESFAHATTAEDAQLFTVELNSLLADRNEWKARAEKAEALVIEATSQTAKKPASPRSLKRLVMTLAIGIAWIPALVVHGFAFALFLPAYALQFFGNSLHDLMVCPVWNARHRMDCREPKSHNEKMSGRGEVQNG